MLGWFQEQLTSGPLPYGPARHVWLSLAARRSGGGQDTQGSRGDLLLAFQNVPAYPMEGYIFVRSRNVKDGTFTVWNGIGCRKYIPFYHFGVDINENVIYQVGDTRLLEVINENKNS